MLLAVLTPLLAQEDNTTTYVGGGCCCCTPFIIWFFFWFVRKFLGEFERGQKQGPTDEEVLSEIPRKKTWIFKGEKVPDWKIAGRQKAVKAVLKFIACTDNWFEKKYMADVADEAFRLVKEAIEARSIQGIEKRLTPDALEEIRTEVKRDRKAKRVHVFGSVTVTDVDVLHLEAATGKENHTFTALISARSKDYVVSEETDDVVEGDKKKNYAYQEFWTFRRTDKRWMVELIRPSSDVDDVLKSKLVLAKIDRDEFARDADPEHLQEVTAR